MTTVEKIKAKILDLAIRGKLVPQDPNDEPASVLLERIKAEKAELVTAKKIKKDKNPSEIIIGSDGVPYEKFEGGNGFNADPKRVNVPFNIPGSWRWVKMESLCEVISKGTTPTGGNKSYLPNGIKYIRAENITSDGRLKIDNTKHINEQQHFGELSRSILKDGDLLITIAGSLGRSAIVHSEALPANTNQAVAFARPIDINLSPFLQTIIMSVSIQSLLLSQKKVTGIPNLTLEIISNLILPLPPLAEQKRIVAKVEELFAYTNQIGSASEEITKTGQRLDKKILDLAIRGKLVLQDPNDEPASKLVKRIEAARNEKTGSKKSRASASHKPTYEIEPPFDIPESWEWVRLGSLIQIIAGVSYQKDEVTTSGVRILRGGNIKEDARIYLHNDDVFLPATYTDEDTSIKTGDIVIVASTGSSTVIGRPAVATETMHNVQIGAFLRIVRSVDDSITSWLPVVFLGNYYRSHIRSKSKGTNIKNLKAEYLTELPVPLPPLAEQKRIVAKIEELRAMTRALTT